MACGVHFSTSRLSHVIPLSPLQAGDTPLPIPRMGPDLMGRFSSLRALKRRSYPPTIPTEPPKSLKLRLFYSGGTYFRENPCALDGALFLCYAVHDSMSFGGENDLISPTGALIERAYLREQFNPICAVRETTT